MNITATLFGQILTFAVLILFVNKVLWGPLMRTLNERTERIQEGLDAAEHGKKQEALAQEHATKVIREAKDKASTVIDHAHERATEILEGAKQEAREEGRRILNAAQAEIEREVNQAREQLRQDMVALIVDGTGQVLKAEIDAGHHDKMIHELTEQF